MQGTQILRNEAYIEVRCNDEGCSATQPFGFARGREHVERPFGFTQGHEPVERPIGFAQDRELVERQMGFLGSRHP